MVRAMSTARIPALALALALASVAACSGEGEGGTTALEVDPNLGKGGDAGLGGGDAGQADGGGAATDGGGSGDADVHGDGASGGAGGDGGDSGGGDGGGAGGDAGSAVIDATPQQQPKLVARLDGVESPVQTFWINPNPQVDNSKLKIKIELENKGEAPLRIDALVFQSETKQIALDWYDPEPAAADYPLMLQPFQTLTVAAVWTTKPTLEGQAIATLTVHSNDPKHPTLQLTVATPCLDAKAALTKPLVQIENAAPFQGKVACTALQNIGCKPLTVSEVVLQTDEGAWQIVQAPAAGTTIGVYGGGDNPSASPVALPICVRYEPPTESQQAAPVTVKVFAQGASAQTVSASFQAVWTPPSSYTLACGGAQKLDLGAGPPGTKASCKLQNHGPAPLLIAEFGLQPADGGVTEAQLAKSYAAAIVQGGPQQAPYTLEKGGVVELQVHWLANESPPAASLRVVLAQQGDTDEVWIPAQAGGCDEAKLVYGPAPPMFQASPGGSHEVVLTLANQSCAPLSIVEGCLTSFAVSQQDACVSGGPSDEYALVGGSLTQTLPPYGMATLKVRFTPSSSSGKPHYGQLHQYWCRGVVNGSFCSGKVEKLSIPLEGTTKAGLIAATATAKPVAGAKVGKTANLVATIQKGNLPIALTGAYRWLVTGRPQGSSLWFDADITDGAARDVAFDLPGTYNVAMRLLSGQPGDLAAQVSSAPATFTVVVAP